MTLAEGNSASDSSRLTRRKRNDDIHKRSEHLIELADAILDTDDNSFDVSKIDSRIRRKNHFSAIFEQVISALYCKPGGLCLRTNSAELHLFHAIGYRSLLRHCYAD